MASPDLYSRDQNAIAHCGQLRFSPLATESAHGSVLTEPGGREIIDLSAAGSAAGLGYAHPAVVRAVTTAVKKMPGVSSLMGTNPYAVELAERLLELTTTSGTERSVYLGLAGSDANSAVHRAIRASSDRPTIVAFEHSYHGGIGPAQGISGVWAAAGAETDPALVLVPYPDLDAVSIALHSHSVAAVFVEPILSDGGVVIPPNGFLSGLSDLCQEYGALLVIDEVKVGLGRTGKLFAFEHDGVVPDVVTIGKSLGGGLPISAAVGPKSVLNSEPASSLLTLAGNPVSAAAALAVLDTLSKENLAEQAARMGTVFGQLLDKLSAAHVVVGSVRNKGLIAGIELQHPDGSPATTTAAKLVYRAWQLGVAMIYVGPEGNIIELTPPLIITETQMKDAFVRLDQALRDVTNGLVSDEEIIAFAGW